MAPVAFREGIGSSDVLIGRDRELGELDRLLSAVERRGAALIVRGEAGVGKSSLIQAVNARAQGRGFQVLSATGVRSEAHLPFAGLDQLLRALRWDLNALPGPQRDAVQAAFGRTSSATPDIFLIALAVLDILGDAASRSPILVIAEDAHWLDESTGQVLAFVGRRLESDAVLLLCALREGFPSPLLSAGLPEMRLSGLDEEASRTLLDARSPGLAREIRRWVLDEAAGNPLALVELPIGLRDAEVKEDADLPAQVPLTARLEHAFLSRVDQLPAATQSLLVVAAIDDRDDLAEVLDATSIMTGATMTSALLSPAVDNRLVEVDPTRIRFRHPLVRSAIYQGASLAERQAVHAALATVLADEPERRVWHRAAAALGPDEAVAGDLEQVATRARNRGALAEAIDALELSAHLSSLRRNRASRLLQAAELAFELGRRDIVAGLVRVAEPLDLGQLEEARLTWIHSMVESDTFDASRVRALVELADRVKADGDPDLAWNILWLVAQRCWWADPGKPLRDLVANAAHRFGPLDGDPRAAAILAYVAPIEQAAAIIDQVSASAANIGGRPEATRLYGTAAGVVGAWDLATGLLGTAADGLRAKGRLGQLARVQVLRSWSAICLSEWSVAKPAADEAERLATEMGEPLWAAAANMLKATLAAVRGDSDLATQLADDAERSIASTRINFVLAMVQIPRGLNALATGRPADAFQELRRMFDPDDPAHHQVIAYWVLGDLIEAAAHSGHRDWGRAFLQEVASDTDQTPASWIGAQVRYARTFLAADEEAEPLFDDALRVDTTRWRFYRARLLLAYGAWLRRQRRVAESRAPLRTARDMFDALGTVPWSERARQELRASGEVSRRRAVAAWDQLSPQELQIAQLAADGLSNREIGQKLYLSHRTVGSHLYRIFPKLGITTRGQLNKALTSR